jgi:hypothetical protein
MAGNIAADRRPATIQRRALQAPGSPAAYLRQIRFTRLGKFPANRRIRRRGLGENNENLSSCNGMLAIAAYGRSAFSIKNNGIYAAWLAVRMSTANGARFNALDQSQMIDDCPYV